MIDSLDNKVQSTFLKIRVNIIISISCSQKLWFKAISLRRYTFTLGINDKI